MEDFPTDRSPRRTTFILFLDSGAALYSSIPTKNNLEAIIIFELEIQSLNTLSDFIITVKYLMKRILKMDAHVDKENLLMQNIIANSRERPRRKLKSIDSDRVKIPAVRSKSRDRYCNQESQKLDDSIQFTFGDWKQQIKRHNKNLNKNSIRLNSLDMIIKTINTEQQQKSNERIKRYEQQRIKQMQSQKGNKYKPLSSIENMLHKLDVLEAKNRKSNKQIDSESKSIPLVKSKKVNHQLFQTKAEVSCKQTHQNFQTIDIDVHKIATRNEIFKKLYMRQKQRYQQILKKYKIQDQVDHTQFFKYFKS